MTQETQTKARVSKVLVHWSEAAGFGENQEYPFSVFERMAERAAQNHKTGGYLKTKVTVFFDNGFEYGDARIDLAEHDEHGFRHHMELAARHAGTERGRAFHRVTDRILGNEEGTNETFYLTSFDNFELSDA